MVDSSLKVQYLTGDTKETVAISLMDVLTTMNTVADNSSNHSNSNTSPTSYQGNNKSNIDANCNSGGTGGDSESPRAKGKSNGFALIVEGTTIHNALVRKLFVV